MNYTWLYTWPSCCWNRMPDKYARYLPVLTALAYRYSGPSFTFILYFCYKFAPELKERLLQLLKETISARALFFHLNPHKMLAFLQSIGAPLGIYYYLILTEDNDADKASHVPYLI